MKHFIILSVLSIFFITGTSQASDAVRFFPDALEQNGKITLTPSFTPDGKTIYFSQSECSPIWECPQRLKISMKDKNGWTTPEFVTLPTADRVDWPNISPDGKTLIFSWSADRSDYENLDIDENFDLYTLDLTNTSAVPTPLFGADINRPRAGEIKRTRYVHNESLPSLTLSGNLYFMTERPDGTGERDIYIARYNGEGAFKTAIPLPAPINSAQRDDGVWVNPEETLMLLNYPNRGGEGGSDIFISKRINGAWSEPRNLGLTINTQYSEFGARLTPDGKQIVFTSDRPFDDTPKGLLQTWVADLPIMD